MFICDNCSKPAGPRIKPIIVVAETCSIGYIVATEDGHKQTYGTAIVHEVNICPTCAGVKVKPEVTPNYMGYKAYVAGLKGHAKGCKKDWKECRACQGIWTYMTQFSPAALSAALEDKLAPPAKFSLASVVMDNVMDRTFDTSKRAKADVHSGLALLGAYEKRGGGL